MLLKFLKRLLVIALIVIAVSALVLAIGSRMSMDDSFAHTRATEALPLFSPNNANGLVRIKANGYDFRARVAGFDNGATAGAQSQRPGVIMLHGAPATSATWPPAMAKLAQAGYRVVAFDQRGYSPGARPEEVDLYATPLLADDALAVATAAGFDKFHLVGHDWGAMVGWTTVLADPGRIISWSGLSIPHPAALTTAVEHDPEQQKKSAYYLLFMLPWLPQAILSFADFAVLRHAYEPMSVPEKTEYIDVFSEPGALTAALKWYRAMKKTDLATTTHSLDIDTPTLFIWGNKDNAVARAPVEAQRQYMKGPYEFIELDAGHWLIQQLPEQVSDAITRHIQRYDNSGG